MAAADRDPLADELAVRGVLARYARALDDGDLAAIGALYHPDATEDRGRFRGDRDAFLPWLAGELAAAGRTWHLLGEPAIALDGDVAHAVTPCLARHAATGRTIALTYHDRLERRDGAWRFAAREARYEPEAGAGGAAASARA